MIRWTLAEGGGSHSVGSVKGFGCPSREDEATQAGLVFITHSNLKRKFQIALPIIKENILDILDRRSMTLTVIGPCNPMEGSVIVGKWFVARRNNSDFATKNRKPYISTP
jgi:hypothetical protein